MLPIIYVGIFLFPFLFTLPINSFIISLWETPPRFLLLRPFHRGALGRPLKRIARSQIARFGHIYTLSDTDIRVRWYVRVPLLLGQLALFSFRARKISRPEKVITLERAIHRTWLRNINWCMSWNKIFAVATVDALWQSLVNLLLSNSAIVIVDISDLRENVAWEIERTRELAEDRVFYLVAAPQKEQSLQTLASLLKGTPEESRIFPYNERGLFEPQRFRSTISSTLLNARPGSEDSGQRPRFLATMATTCFAIGVIPILCLVLPMLHIGLPLWNNWPDDSHSWPGLATFVNSGVLRVEAYGIFTRLLLLVACRVSVPIHFLFGLQTVLLLATPAGILWQF
jgi:hypothetical protein